MADVEMDSEIKFMAFDSLRVSYVLYSWKGNDRDGLSLMGSKQNLF